MDKTKGENALTGFCRQLNSRLEALSDGGKTRFRIRTAGKVIEVRTTDAALADTLLRYIASAEAEEDAVPDAVFHYWRDDCSRFAPPEAPAKEGVWRLRTEQGFVMLTMPCGELAAVDLENSRYYYCVDHEAGAEPVLYGHPMPEMFGLWAMNNSMLMLHSACVGADGTGVLIAARGGGGKSTLAVSCLTGGFDFVGDDYILVNREGPLRAMPLYRTVGLTPGMREALRPEMPVLRVDEEREGKLLLDASAYPFREELPVKAIVHPVIAGLKEPEIVRVKPGPVLVKLIHSTAQQLGVFRDPEPYRIMSARLSDLPVFELRLSPDLDRNREKLREFITTEVRNV